MGDRAAGDGCVVCGHPVSIKDGIQDRCGHHRRQLLRNQARAAGRPDPTTHRGPLAPRKRKDPVLSPLEFLSPQQFKIDHLAGEHDDIPVVACILCIRRAGGRINHVEDSIER